MKVIECNDIICATINFTRNCTFILDAPWELKAAYAFRVYDFNCDAYLCQDDLAETLICITGNQQSHAQYLITQVITHLRFIINKLNNEFEVYQLSWASKKF